MFLIAIPSDDRVLFWMGTGKEGEPWFSNDPCEALVVKSESKAEEICNYLKFLNPIIL